MKTTTMSLDLPLAADSLKSGIAATERMPMVKQEPIFSNLHVVRAARRRRRRGWNWPRIGAFFFIVLVLTWMLCSCEHTQQWTHEGEVELVSPWLSGSLMGLLAASVLAMVWMAVRKQAENEAFFDALRRADAGMRNQDTEAFGSGGKNNELRPFTVGPLECLNEPWWDDRPEDIFEPLRDGDEPIPAEDVERILIACAAEARCVSKHVRRAQRTLSLDDYGDELELAQRKIEAVIRCVEAVVERFAVRSSQFAVLEGKGDAV